LLVAGATYGTAFPQKERSLIHFHQRTNETSGGASTLHWQSVHVITSSKKVFLAEKQKTIPQGWFL